jgi:tRNA threonylcarbamoyladenosine biosynthesis protein TsaB
MDLTLAIETSNPSSGGHAGVAIGGRKAIRVEPIAPTGRHDDDLLPAIDRLTARLGVAPGDLKRVAVSVGPGGFTGLRVAVAAAKMICEVTGARAVAVPSALVVARRVPARGPFAVALASKGETTFLTVFDETGRPRTDGSLARAAELDGLDVGLLIADRFLPESFREACERLGIRIESPEFDAGGCLEAAAGLPDSDASTLVPLYPREPEAVTKWRHLHGEA